MLNPQAFYLSCVCCDRFKHAKLLLLPEKQQTEAEGLLFPAGMLLALEHKSGLHELIARACLDEMAAQTLLQSAPNQPSLSSSSSTSSSSTSSIASPHACAVKLPLLQDLQQESGSHPMQGDLLLSLPLSSYYAAAAAALQTLTLQRHKTAAAVDAVSAPFSSSEGHVQYQRQQASPAQALPPWHLLPETESFPGAHFSDLNASIEAIRTHGTSYVAALYGSTQALVQALQALSTADGSDSAGSSTANAGVERVSPHPSQHSGRALLRTLLSAPAAEEGIAPSVLTAVNVIVDWRGLVYSSRISSQREAEALRSMRQQAAAQEKSGGSRFLAYLRNRNSADDGNSSSSSIGGDNKASSTSSSSTSASPALEFSERASTWAISPALQQWQQHALKAKGSSSNEREGLREGLASKLAAATQLHPQDAILTRTGCIGALSASDHSILPQLSHRQLSLLQHAPPAASIAACVPAEAFPGVEEQSLSLPTGHYDEIILLGHPWGHNPYHWLAEALGRIYPLLPYLLAFPHVKLHVGEPQMSQLEEVTAQLAAADVEEEEEREAAEGSSIHNSTSSGNSRCSLKQKLLSDLWGSSSMQGSLLFRSLELLGLDPSKRVISGTVFSRRVLVPEGIWCSRPQPVALLAAREALRQTIRLEGPDLALAGAGGAAAAAVRKVPAAPTFSDKEEQQRASEKAELLQQCQLWPLQTLQQLAAKHASSSALSSSPGSADKAAAASNGMPLKVLLMHRGKHGGDAARAILNHKSLLRVLRRAFQPLARNLTAAAAAGLSAGARHDLAAAAALAGLGARAGGTVEAAMDPGSSSVVQVIDDSALPPLQALLRVFATADVIGERGAMSSREAPGAVPSFTVYPSACFTIIPFFPLLPASAIPSAVSPHGAGSVNLLVAKPGACYVEALPEGHTAYYFLALAQQLNIDFSQVLVPGASKGSAFAVDVRKVLQMVCACLARRGSS